MPFGAPSEAIELPDALAALGERLVGVRHVDGVTPILRPPIVIAGLVEIGVRMPMRCAVAAIWPVPTSIPTSANTELSD